jgi:hypothetical protein
MLWPQVWEGFGRLRFQPRPGAGVSGVGGGNLFALRRAVRNGSVWIEHSLSFRGRARLFFTDERWKDESKKHYARLSLPGKAATFLEAFWPE